ncbi:AMP-binding protein, partial [Streptomyces hainanensis]
MRANAMMPGDHTESLPLTAAQREIWIAHQLSTDKASYNLAEYVDIRGAVDVGLLTTAIRRANLEAETLKVRFTLLDDGTPRQTVQPLTEEDWPVPLVDATDRNDPRAALETWMRDDVARPVDLLDGPVYADTLFKLADDHYLWYRRAHHIVLDGHSGALITQRAAEIYGELATAGENATPPAPPLDPLRTLLAADAEYRASQACADDRVFWRGRLGDCPPPATLTTGGSTDERLRTRSTGHLPAEDFERLKASARRCRTGWTALAMAALGIYLHRLTGERELTLGLPTAGRVRSELKTVPGMISNAVPLRLTVQPDDRLVDVVRRTSAEAREVMRHQRYRSEDMRRDLGLSGGGEPLFGPQINIMPFGHRLRFGPCDAVVRNISLGAFDDLAIALYPGVDDGSLRADLDANPARYGPKEPGAHLNAFLSLLRNLALAEPDTPINTLDLLDASAPGRPNPDSDATPPPVVDATLPELFERRARETPDAVAVVFEDEEVTYGELDLRATRLAWELTARGVGRERVVAVALPRSVELVVALLAVVKAGGAYLPLDPDYPGDRVAFMLADARPVCLVTTADLAARLSPDLDTVILDDPETEQALRTWSTRSPLDGADTATPSPGNAAYVIYTSGSTGRPKGVAVTHRNVVGLLTATEPWFGFGPDDRWTLFHSYAFDFAVWEMWGALLHGGSLVVVPRNVARSPVDFLRLLVARRVTVLNQTPSAFHQLARADEENPELGGRLALRTVIFGGEALDPARLAGWYARHDAASPTLVNMYGITETTVHVTHRPLDVHDSVDRTASVIGRGIPGLRLHVLDAGLRPVPVGVVGELYVGGVQ